MHYQRDNRSTDWLTYRNRITNKTVNDSLSIPSRHSRAHPFALLQILNGNTNTYLAEKRTLPSLVLAKRVRIVPYSPRWRTVCMRVELYGCPYYGKTIASMHGIETCAVRAQEE